MPVSEPGCWERLQAGFAAAFGGRPCVLARAPGRANLIGEHTDYNDGFVLPMAIDRDVGIAARPRADRRVHLRSLDLEQSAEFDQGALDAPLAAPWSRYVRGVARELEAEGYSLCGLEAAIQGNVPIGAGLSSSAALEVAAARAFCAVSGIDWDGARIAGLCQRAERRFTGAQCGIMDQFIAAMGRKGQALLLDCRSLEYQHVPLPAGLTVVIADSGVRRTLAGSAYNERRAQSEEAARFIGVPTLRDVSVESLEGLIDRLPRLLRRRVRHVVTENRRTLDAADALRRGDAPRLGRLMVASHASLRDDYDVSCPELDALVEIALEHSGCLGARLTGAGFGGCTVNLVMASELDGFAAHVRERYCGSFGLDPDVFACVASDGASVVWQGQTGRAHWRAGDRPTGAARDDRVAASRSAGAGGANLATQGPVTRLTAKTKLFYGFGDFAPALSITVVQFFFLYFLTDVAHLSPALAGVALLVGRAWDAVNDPLFGLISDRTRTRWGRRRPFLLIGSIPFGIAFFLLWWVPPLRSQAGLLLYYAALYVVFDTAFTAVQLPYSALTVDLTQDYDERTSVTGYRMIFSIGAGLIGAVVPLTIVGLFPSEQVGFLAQGAILGAVIAVPMLVAFFATRERADYQRSVPLKPMDAIRSAVTNRAFVLAAGIFLLAWVSVDIIAAVLVYYLRYWVGIQGDASVVLGIMFVVAILALPLWVRLSGRLGKKQAFMCGMTFWAVVQVALVFLGRGIEWPVYPLAALGGIGISAVHVIPQSLIPDVTDVDELTSGTRQEGVYYGFLVFMQKLASALGLFLVGQFLGWAGYAPNVAQSERALWAIRMLVGPIPAVIVVGAIVFAAYYPLTRERHQQVMAELEARRRAVEANASDAA